MCMELVKKELWDIIFVPCQLSPEKACNLVLVQNITLTPLQKVFATLNTPLHFMLIVKAKSGVPLYGNKEPAEANSQVFSYYE